MPMPPIVYFDASWLLKPENKSVLDAAFRFGGIGKADGVTWGAMPGTGKLGAHLPDGTWVERGEFWNAVWVWVRQDFHPGVQYITVIVNGGLEFCIPISKWNDAYHLPPQPDFGV